MHGWPGHKLSLQLNSKDVQEREGEAPSWFNAVEAGVLVDLVSSLLKQGLVHAQGASVTPADVGVIATYRRQVGPLHVLCLLCLLDPPHSLGLRCLLAPPSMARHCAWVLK